MKAARLTAALSIVSSVLLFATTVPSVHGLDWGVSVDNSSGVSGPTDGLEYTQSNRAALFVTHEFSAELEMAAQASYAFSLDRTYLVDIDYLYAHLRRPIKQAQRDLWLIDLQAGRFVFADFTERVLRTRADGLRLGIESARMDVTAGLGYTGFVLLPNTTVQLSRADVNDDADDKLLGPPRLVGFLAFMLPEYISGQDVVITFVGQKDLRPQGDLDELEGSGRVDTQYVGLGVSGPLLPQLYYDSFLYFGFGRAMAESDLGSGVYEYRQISAQMAGLGLQYFMPEVSKSIVEANLLVSSGGADQVSYFEGATEGGSKQFLSITDSPLGLIFSPRPGNLIVADAGYAIRPFAYAGNTLQNLQTRLRYFAFFRPTSEVISEVGANTESDARYLGSEIDLMVNYRPFSDLGVGLALAAFFPSTGSDRGFIEGSRETELLARFDLSFSF